MKVLIAVASIMVNVMAGQDTQCLPNGCFYDQEEDLTREISCGLDGRQRVLYFHGNNGCDVPKYLLRDATYISPLNNPCCKSKRPGTSCGGSCNKNSECDKNSGCASCVDNVCKNVQGELSAGELGELSDMATSYSIILENESGIEQNVGIYAENLIIGLGYPIIFSGIGVPPGGRGDFNWDTDLGLSLSSGSPGCIPLSGGIEYSRTGRVIDANSTNGHGALISYNSSADVFEIFSQTYPVYQPDTIETNTDGSFSNQKAVDDCFSLCVTLSEEPIFAIEGLPYNYYSFTLTSTYYLTTDFSQAGTTVNANVSTKVVFENGENYVKCTLIANNDIVCV